MTSYIMKGNLTERQIEADVASYLGWCAQGMPFRLIDVDEQATGADRLLDVTMPVYMQFKKSTGLAPLGIETRKRRANESPLQGIRRFRREKELADDPSLYFQLRKKAEHAADLQHNVLLAHNQPFISYAVYVAPLHLDKDQYYNELCQGGRDLHDPWNWRMARMWHDRPGSACLSRFDFQPFLRNHVSIAPHERVDDHHHYYAFSTTGDEVSWHSPTVIDDGPFRLSDFMTARTRELLTGGSLLPTPGDALEGALAASERLGIGMPDSFGGESAFERLRTYGRWLHSQFGIRQILLCGRHKELEQIRRSLDAR